MRRAAFLPLLLAVPLIAPAPAAACHPVPDPTPPGYRDHGCGDTSKGGVAQSVTSVSVGDDFFDPSTVRIQPGEAVRWVWASDSSSQHNVAADPNQTERFRSAFLEGAGKSFSHTFSKPGRFTYLCEIHSNTMRGVVEVGPAPFPDTKLPLARALAVRVTGAVAKLSFGLSEKARVKVVLSGPSRRTTSKSLRSGKRSLSFRRLRAGSYKATLRPTDSAGNRGPSASKRFRIR